MAEERLRDMLEKYRRRYEKGNRKERSRLLNEFCGMSTPVKERHMNTFRLPTCVQETRKSEPL